MPLIFSPSANSLCDDWDNNFNILNTALVNSEILQQGLMLNTRIDGTSFNVPIPWFNNFIKTGTLALQASPNANLLDYTILTYQINALPFTVAPAGTIVLNAGDPVLPRVDVVYLTTTNAIVYLVGVAAINPVSPAVPLNTLVATYIGVDPLASGSGGYTLTQVNLTSNTAISPGFIVNQTLRWSGASWVPTNSMFTNAFGQVTVGNGPGFGIMDAATKLQVNGAIQIIDIGIPPAPVTNKLYSIAGQLYWNGQLLGYLGTVVGSHLRWNGTSFVEETQFTTTTLGGAAWLSSFNNTNAGGLQTRTDLGRSLITANRGSTMFVGEAGNLTQGYIDLSMAPTQTAEIRFVVDDGNIGSQTKYLQDDNEIRLTNFNGTTTAEIEITPTHTKIVGGKAVSQRNTAVNTTMTSNDFMLVTTVNPLTITLPLAPINGQEFIFKAISATGGSPITINGNGKNINGAATSTITNNYGTTNIVFNTTLNSWLSI